MSSGRQRRSQRKRKEREQQKMGGTIESRYTRLGVYTLQEVLDFIPFDGEGKPLRDVAKDKEYLGYIVHMDSMRYRLYKTRGTTCVSCGLVGTFFSLDLPREMARPHFNLYGLDENGEEVMLTKDHIQPLSQGGPNIFSNLQPMCEKCNTKKGNKWDGQPRIKGTDGRSTVDAYNGTPTEACRAHG